MKARIYIITTAGTWRGDPVDSEQVDRKWVGGFLKEYPAMNYVSLEVNGRTIYFNPRNIVGIYLDEK